MLIFGTIFLSFVTELNFRVNKKIKIKNKKCTIIYASSTIVQASNICISSKSQ